MRIDSERGILYASRAEISAMLSKTTYAQISSLFSADTTDDDNDQAFSFEDLPIGVWNMIFDALGVNRMSQVLLTLRNVSRRLAHMVRDYVKSQASMDFSGQSRLTGYFIALITTGIDSLPNLRSLNVSNTLIGPHSLYSILKLCRTSLEILRASECHGLYSASWRFDDHSENWFRFLVYCPRLRVLDIHVSEQYSRSWAKTSCTLLQQLSVTYGPDNTNKTNLLPQCGMMATSIVRIMCIETLEELDISGNFYFVRLLTDGRSIDWYTNRYSTDNMRQQLLDGMRSTEGYLKSRETIVNDTQKEFPDVFQSRQQLQHLLKSETGMYWPRLHTINAERTAVSRYFISALVGLSSLRSLSITSIYERSLFPNLQSQSLIPSVYEDTSAIDTISELVQGNGEGRPPVFYKLKIQLPEKSSLSVRLINFDSLVSHAFALSNTPLNRCTEELGIVWNVPHGAVNDSSYTTTEITATSAEEEDTTTGGDHAIIGSDDMAEDDFFIDTPSSVDIGQMILRSGTMNKKCVRKLELEIAEPDTYAVAKTMMTASTGRISDNTYEFGLRSLDLTLCPVGAEILGFITMHTQLEELRIGRTAILGKTTSKRMNSAQRNDILNLLRDSASRINFKSNMTRYGLYSWGEDLIKLKNLQILALPYGAPLMMTSRRKLSFIFVSGLKRLHTLFIPGQVALTATELNLLPAESLEMLDLSFGNLQFTRHDDTSLTESVLNRMQHLRILSVRGIEMTLSLQRCVTMLRGLEILKCEMPLIETGENSPGFAPGTPSSVIDVRRIRMLLVGGTFTTLSSRQPQTIRGLRVLPRLRDLIFSISGSQRFQHPEAINPLLQESFWTSIKFESLREANIAEYVMKITNPGFFNQAIFRRAVMRILVATNIKLEIGKFYQMPSAARVVDVSDETRSISSSSYSEQMPPPPTSMSTTTTTTSNTQPQMASSSTTTSNNPQNLGVFDISGDVIMADTKRL